MRLKQAAASSVVLVVSLLAVSSCDGGSSRTTPSKVDSQDASTALPRTAWTHAKYDDVKQGGTLIQAIGQLPINYNMNQINGPLYATLMVQRPLLLSGLTFTADGSWQVDPNVIESAKVVSEEPQQIEVKLNPEAVWSDGKPITYVDFVDTWKALRGSDPEFQIASNVGFKDISDVQQGDTEFEYTITWAKKNADWPQFMYPVAPSTVTADPLSFNTGYVKKMFPGNGPYVVSDVDASAGVITQVPNPLWWGRKPKLDKLIFRVVSSEGLGQAFANDEINLLDTMANPDALAQAAGRSDAKIQKSVGLGWTHLMLNGSEPPLNDVHVRRAIAAAIDRETITAVAQGPLGVEPTVAGSVIYVPGQAGYQDAAAQGIPFDLEKSASELETAGYTKGSDGMFEKGGRPLAISITVPSGVPNSVQRAQLLQGMLKTAGISLTLDTVPAAKYFDEYVSADTLNFETASFTGSGSQFPVSGAQSIFNPADSGQNYTGITDDRLADLWDRANAELDPAKQQVIAHEIDTVIFEYVPIIPISNTPSIWALESNIVNIGASQFEIPDYTHVGFSE